MKEILFGWITKGQYELSFLDSIIAFIEIFGGIFIVLCILVSIAELIDEIKFRRKE